MNTFKNNLRASLYYDMTATDTVIWLNQLVSSTDATTRLNAWPTCDASHTFTLTLESTEDNKVREIIECTGVTANTTDYITFSCTRAKENTVAIAHNKNTTNVENRITAAALTAIVDALTTTMASVSANTTSISTITSNVNALTSTLIGSIQSVMASSTYVPNGCVPADGAEYTKTQFATLYTDYLESGKLLTCTYTEWATQVGLTGNCAKFALDTTNQKFKVPLIKDGDSITQAASAAELGKSIKAGLPNVKWSVDVHTGIFNPANLTGAAQAGATKSSYYWSQSSGTYWYPDYSVDLSRGSSVYRDDVTTVLTDGVRLRHFVVVASTQNNASMFDWSNYMAALAGKANADLSNITNNAIGLYLYVRDEKSSGTNGGSTSAATWHTRDLNTVKNNNIGATVASSRVTLPAGSYYVRARTPAHTTGGARAAIYDTTNSVYLAYSPTFEVSDTYNVQIDCTLEEKITLATATTIELRMYALLANTNGLGRASAPIAGVKETYSELRIWKM